MTEERFFPILMPEKLAKEYLGGAAPDQLIVPIVMGHRRWYSREALDRAVREKGRILPVEGSAGRGGAEEAYDELKKAASG
ncbi:MAG: hypothetical protein AAGA09_01635 [Pseudomonadota bacterium]